jgi:hypothetical protein
VAGAISAGFIVRESTHYEGESDWLCVFGVGDPEYSKARSRHMAKGGRVICWDIGYMGQRVFHKEFPAQTYSRVSVDHDHPLPEFLDRTPPDPSRWQRLGKGLSECSDPAGPVLVIGMGNKSRMHLGDHSWEQNALQLAKAQFPDRRVFYRTKPKGKVKDTVKWPYQSFETTIEEALLGKSLVICKHSNVAIDACLAGVPVQCEDGAAYRLYRNGSTPTVEQRLDFLYRLCWWQWRFLEMDKAWKFLFSTVAQVDSLSVEVA